MVLSPTAGMWAGVSANGTSPSFSLPSGAVPAGTLLVNSTVTGVSGTGTPTLQVFLDVSDVNGNWFTVVTLTAQTAVGVQTGSGAPLSATPYAIGTYRLRWTVTGTNPQFSLALAVFGN